MGARYSGVGLLTGPRLLVLVWAPLVTLGVCESGDVGGVELLEFNGGAPAQGTVASLPIVEDLQALKDRVGQLHSGPPPSAVQQFGLPAGQKDSMMALS